MPYPSLTFAQLLDNATRQELEQFISLLQGYLSAEHKDDGTHGAITADSVAATGAITGASGTFTGDVIAQSGTGLEVGIGQLNTVGSASLLPSLPKYGVLIGGVTDGYVIVKRVKGSAFSGGGTYAWAIYDLAESTSTPMAWIAKDNGSYSFIDGGTGATTLRIGNANRPMLEAYTTNGYYERGRSVPLGEGTDVAYAGGNFTGSGTLTITVQSGDQTAFRYTLVGKLMTVFLTLDTISVSGVGNEILVAIPGGYTSAKFTGCGFGGLYDNSGSVRGAAFAYVTTSGTQIHIAKMDNSNLTASANNTYVYGQITFEVA